MAMDVIPALAAKEITVTDLTSDSFTSDTIISESAAITQTSTTGSTLTISRNLGSASTDSAVVQITQDNAGDDQNAVQIQNDGSGTSLKIINSASESQYLGLTNNATGTNWFFRDLGSASTAGPVVFIEQDNTGDDQIALQIQQDGASEGIDVDHNNAVGYAVDITSTSENQYASIRAINTTTSGYAGVFQKDVATATYPTVSITQLSTSGGQPCLVLDQNDTSEGFIDFLGTDTGAIATSTTNSNASFTIEINGTKYKVPCYTP